jgi:epoxyqueuosine reductase QueG
LVELKEKIKECAKANDVDLIGFAGKERFEGFDPRYNPFSIFPEGNTVIVLGKRITRGTLRGVEEGTNFMDYQTFGYGWLDNDFISLACYNITRIIENEGFEAVPVFPNPPEVYGQGVPVKSYALSPNVAPDFTYAAIACGLGEIGMHGEFLTKEFGPRQRFQMVITDAKIKQDDIPTPQICIQCGKCADICPLGAIDKNSFEEINICGKKIKKYKVDFSLCKKCKNGAFANRLYPAGKPDRLAALCVRTCICSLEENKALENLFSNSFRKRKAWARDVFDKNVDIES